MSCEKTNENGVYHYPAYGSFMNMIGSLPAEDYQEYWRLYDRKKRSAEQEQRLHDLSERARQLWSEQKAQEPDTWFEDLKNRMWAKHDAEQAKKPVAGS